jgi:hypothetical protein
MQQVVGQRVGVQQVVMQQVVVQRVGVQQVVMQRVVVQRDVVQRDVVQRDVVQRDVVQRVGVQQVVVQRVVVQQVGVQQVVMQRVVVQQVVMQHYYIISSPPNEHGGPTEITLPISSLTISARQTPYPSSPPTHTLNHKQNMLLPHNQECDEASHSE